MLATEGKRNEESGRQIVEESEAEKKKDSFSQILWEAVTWAGY